MINIGKNSILCCLGSSITQHGWWVYEVMDYIARFRSEEKIKVYNCGVGGDTANWARYRLVDDVLWFNPTHVFIMFGANDIKRELYLPSIDETDEILVKRQEAIRVFEKSTREIATKLKSKNIEVILGAAAPYDEIQECNTENLKKCNEGLKKCAKIMQEIATELDCGFVNINKEFSDVKKKWDKNKEWLYKQDRVHLLPEGYRIIGKIFLKNMGFDVTFPNSKDEYEKNLTPENIMNNRRFDLEQIIRDVAYIKWGWFNPIHGNATDEQDMMIQLLEKYADSNCEQWLRDAISHYLLYKDKFDEMRYNLIRATEMLY